MRSSGVCIPSLRSPVERRAATLLELVVVLTIVAVLSGFGLPMLLRGLDRLEARAAARETNAAFFIARSAAIAAGRRTDVFIDTAGRGLRVVNGLETVLAVPVGLRHGVAVASSRPAMSYGPTGLGYGGANLRVILSRGAAAETVFVSREGRTKVGTRAGR